MQHNNIFSNSHEYMRRTCERTMWREQGAASLTEKQHYTSWPCNVDIVWSCCGRSCKSDMCWISHERRCSAKWCTTSSTHSNIRLSWDKTAITLQHLGWGGGEAAKKQYAGMLNSFPKCAKTGEPQLTKTLLYQPVVSLEADSSLWPDE